MRIFVDENIPQQIATLLRTAGHTVEYVSREVDDLIILEDAYTQQALLVTLDKDFERLVISEHRPTAGVLLLRISRNIPIQHRAQILINVLKHRQREVQGNLTTLTEAIVDIRSPLL